MPRISVVICCANVADQLEHACRSVGWADEILVVDSGSTDDTAAVAQRLAHRYVLEPWRGYTRQKAYGASLARNDWVLVLDGDECVSQALGGEIAALTDAELDRCDVLLMRRRNYLFGRPVRAWWPDWQSRLIHRTRCRWADESLHDDRLPSDPSRTRRLRGWLEHKRFSQAGFCDYFGGRRLDDRLLMVARQLHARGKRCSALDLILRPWGAFWKSYLFKAGFLDGTFGLAVAQKTAVTTQLKYAALWAVQNGYAGRDGADDPPAGDRPIAQPADAKADRSDEQQATGRGGAEG